MMDITSATEAVSAADTLTTTLISAGIGALIAGLFQLIDKIIDLRTSRKKDREERERKDSDDYIEKKERVYIAAIGRLLQMRRAFDYTRESLVRNDDLRQALERENQDYYEVAPQLRLYAPDDICNDYMRLLALFSDCAYAPQTGPRLSEQGKWAFNNQVTLLAHRMQEDLGIRKYQDAPTLIQCPVCGVEHDYVSKKCPKCGLPYEDLRGKAVEIIQQSRTIRRETDMEFPK